MVVDDGHTFVDGDEEKSHDDEGERTVGVGAVQISLDFPVKTTSKTTSAGRFASDYGDVGDDGANANEHEHDDQSGERQSRIASRRDNHRS